MPKDALLIVDAQNDFFPGGALAVPQGDEIIEPVKIMVAYATNNQMLVVASRDWHPAETNHFETWPVHCVQNTWGARLHSRLKLYELPPWKMVIVSKGTKKDEDAYSAFQGGSDTGGWKGMKLQYILKAQGIEKLFVCGLATDYCVKATVLDALRLGYKVVVLEDAIRGVAPDTTAAAINEMKDAGAIFATTDTVLGFYTPPYE